VVTTRHLTRQELGDLVKKDQSLHVVTLARSGKVCLVRPGALVTKPGHRVLFANRTGDKLRLFFPEGGLFEELRRTGPIVEVPAEGQSGWFTVKGDKRKRTNVYPYAVFCAVNEDFAIASSNPDIIIDW
jgi:hypothetical protein